MTGLVLLASYPKSGNTWLRAWLTSLRRNQDIIDINALEGVGAPNRKILDDFLEVESSDLRPAEIARLRPLMYAHMVKSATTDIYLKTHDAWLPALGADTPPFPSELIRAVIYLTRDPRDIAPSFAHHSGTSINRIIRRLNDSQSILAKSQFRLNQQLPQLLSSWSRHVESWLDSDLPVLWIRYEDMVTDPHVTFGKIACYLSLSDDPAVIAQTVEATRFQRLQNSEASAGFRETQNIATANFFRQGKIGAWRQDLTTEQAHLIVKNNSTVMRRLGYL